MLDPQNKSAWIQVEDALRNEQKRRKLQSLLLTAVQVTEGEVRQRFEDRSVTMDAEFALFDANRLVPDSAVQVTDDDLRKQYDAHPEDFKAKASRRLKYVTLSLAPSSEDTAQVEQEISHILQQVKDKPSDFADLAKTYSEIPQSDAFFKHGELSRTKESAVFAASKGSVVGPIRDADGIHLIKVLDVRQGKDEYVHASHILLNVAGADTNAVLQKARELAREARSGRNFAELARANSQDFQSAIQGGDLGWGGKGSWVKPFEDAVFRARPGEVVGPVRTQFGYHIIKVLAKDRREVKIAAISMKVKSSAQTSDLIYKQAEDFAYLAKEEGFDKAAEFSKYEVRETPEFTKGSVVPGLGFNEAANNFAFMDKVGTISSPTSVSGGVAVMLVSATRDEGIRPFDDVKATLRGMAIREKKMAKVREMAEAFAKTLGPNADLLAAAKASAQVIAQRTGPFKATDAPAGVGRDLKFIGQACALSPGQVSKPFEGARGYYVVKMVTKTPVDTTRYAVERNSLRDQLLQEKRNRVLADWQTALRQKADIVDHRDKFYR
jgi:peptidyl-prolyl cis-trans isomerase D